MGSQNHGLNISLPFTSLSLGTQSAALWPIVIINIESASKLQNVAMPRILRVNAEFQKLSAKLSKTKRETGKYSDILRIKCF
jgi:hypothetical protein